MPAFVDQHVDMAERLHGRGDHAVAVVRDCDVGPYGYAPAPGRLDQLLRFQEPVVAPCADRDVRSRLREALGECDTQT
jgi:hypothetical protein